MGKVCAADTTIQFCAAVATDLPVAALIFKRAKIVPGRE